MQRPIYMDSHATTPCDPRVAQVMAPLFTEAFGNASSALHAYGWEARALVDRAREQVAALVGGQAGEIVFTSGATESNNLSIAGVARLRGCQGGHLITCATEHPSVLEPCRRLEREGWELTVLPVDGDGRLDPAQVEQAIGSRTVLVSVMMANNETGVVQPIEPIGAVCKARGVLFHCDAVQALAWGAVDVERLGVDLLSVSAHKMYGPKGVGALWVRRRAPHVRLEPLMNGGHQEGGLRPGTLNVPGIAGLGLAAELAVDEGPGQALRVSALRDRLLGLIVARIPGAQVNGSREHRLPNNLNISLPGVEAQRLLGQMRQVAVSTGSACTSDLNGPSPVLLAMGLDPARALASLRFGLHRQTTPGEVETAAAALETAYQEISGHRGLNACKS